MCSQTYTFCECLSLEATLEAQGGSSPKLIVGLGIKTKILNNYNWE